MTELKTLEDIDNEADDSYSTCGAYEGLIKQQAIKDLINIYELEKILKIKLNDKNVSILTKYIMWKNNIKEGDVK